MSEDLRIRLLIVDDEQSIRRLCVTVGEALGFVCLEAASGETALALLEEQPAHMILTDMVMPHMSGLEFLEKVKKLLPRTEIAVMTGHGSVETAVQAMKLGAYDYIAKPFSPLEELRLFLRRMAEKVRLVEENQFLRDRMDTETQLHGIVGSSAKIQDVLRMVSRLKDTRTPVLITGESGTGKELVARAIHFRGSFANRPFVAVDCGSLVPTLIESELFGYEKGAFTGALKVENRPVPVGRRRHHLPRRNRRTPARDAGQAPARPAGERSPPRRQQPTNARSMCASSPPPTAISSRNTAPGTFRKDLYFRLNVVTVHVPPLRERRSDIPMLAHWFLERCVPGRSVQVTNAAMKSLLQYDWPGNVRELENCVERAVALGNQQTLDVDDLPPAIASTSLPQERDAAEFRTRPLHHRPRRHRAHHHRARLRTSKRRQSASRKNARHQPCHALPQTKALQHRRPPAPGFERCASVEIVNHRGHGGAPRNPANSSRATSRFLSDLRGSRAFTRSSRGKVASFLSSTVSSAPSVVKNS